MGRRTHSDTDPLIRFSAALTSREHLLSVVLQIEPGDEINATALAARLPELGVPAISQELRTIEQTGLLRERDSAGRYRQFEVTDAGAWKALRSLAKAAQNEKVSVP
jgi:predicted transcriptional regulator